MQPGCQCWLQGMEENWSSDGHCKLGVPPLETLHISTLHVLLEDTLGPEREREREREGGRERERGRERDSPASGCLSICVMPQADFLPNLVPDFYWCISTGRRGDRVEWHARPDVIFYSCEAGGWAERRGGGGDGGRGGGMEFRWAEGLFTVGLFPTSNFLPGDFLKSIRFELCYGRNESFSCRALDFVSPLFKMLPFTYL